MSKVQIIIPQSILELLILIVEMGLGTVIIV